MCAASLIGQFSACHSSTGAFLAQPCSLPTPQIIGKPVNHAATKMNYDNLSMVWGPNFLRCNSEDPMVIFNSTKREMTFVRQLILHLNTDEVADMFDADL